MNDEHRKQATVIDLDYARSRLGDDADEVLPVVAQALLAECPERIEEMEQSMGNGDTVCLARAAHTLQGAVKIFAAAELVETAQLIQQRADQGDLKAIPQLIEDLRRQVGRVSDTLRATFDLPA